MAIEVSRAARVAGGPRHSRVIGPGGAAYWLSAAWLTRIVPAVVRGGTPAYLHGTGLTVNVGYVQDLALWLPLLAVAAAWLWRRQPWGYLLAGAGLVMWVLESTSIAADQWYGHAAAPASPVASGVLVPAFAALAVIGLIPAGVRPGLAAGYLAGLLLVAWIAVELLILRRYFFLQPVIAGIGAAEILLAWRWQRSGKIVTGSRDQRP